LSKVFDLLTSAISAEADLAHGDIEADNEESLPRHKQLLQMYAFLLQWAVSAIETRESEQRAATTTSRQGKGTKAKKDANWDPSKQLEKSLDVMSKVLSLRLVRIFVPTSERDTFVGMFTKAAFHILEDEARVKKPLIKRSCFKVLCIAVRHHGQAFSMLGVDPRHKKHG
jgi:condensin complex subunit 1